MEGTEFCRPAACDPAVRFRKQLEQGAWIWRSRFVRQHCLVRLEVVFGSGSGVEMDLPISRRARQGADSLRTASK